ncbi:hypothetical protein ERY430_40848 [Erythrobacter sp. EC-HK427]|nr:hypothetical protein ERY430_40848 [Erythrobacter sp. EC-HK427]
MVRCRFARPGIDGLVSGGGMISVVDHIPGVAKGVVPALIEQAFIARLFEHFETGKGKARQRGNSYPHFNILLSHTNTRKCIWFCQKPNTDEVALTVALA